MKLSNRLQKLLDLVTKGCILADIGSDHGYLPIAHIKYNNGKKAYACDINQNALNQAKQTLKKYPSDKIVLQLMNGIEQLALDVEEIVIAGMGFDTIRKILEHKNVFNVRKIIIQCNKNNDKLRQFLATRHLYIHYEELVFDQNHYYELLVCGKDYCSNPKTIKDSPLYIQYVESQMKQLRSIAGFEDNAKLKEKYNELFQKTLSTTNTTTTEKQSS